MGAGIRDGTPHVVNCSATLVRSPLPVRGSCVIPSRADDSSDMLFTACFFYNGSSPPVRTEPQTRGLGGILPADPEAAQRFLDPRPETTIGLPPAD